MVNTFLPYSDFKRSAKALDYRRLGKQRVEAWQVLNALRGQTKGWVNHPITKMWRGHERSLCEYGIAICDEWISRGYKDTMRERFIAIYSELPDTGLPLWLGNKKVHRSHQSNLKRKNSDHYQFKVPNDLPYVWVDRVTNYDNCKPITTWYIERKKINESKKKVGKAL